jgi:hypothetical protein
VKTATFYIRDKVTFYKDLSQHDHSII